MNAPSRFLPSQMLALGSSTSRVLLALYLLWAYANIYILLLGGTLMRGLFDRGNAFYPYTYHGGQGLHLDWTMVKEYDCVELYLYVLGPLVVYYAGRLIFARSRKEIDVTPPSSNLVAGG